MRDQGSDWFRRPELILSDLIRSHAREDSRVRHYRRAVVVAIDHEGGRLQNDGGDGSVSDGNGKTFRALIGPENPRGSVKARVLTDGLDRLLSDDDLRVFWPMFPQDQFSIPISPGEHVYVIFEDEGFDHGLWISRVSGHDSANTFVGRSSYTAPSSPSSAMDSFEPNEPEYDTSDEHASLAPAVDPTSLFDSGDQ